MRDGLLPGAFEADRSGIGVRSAAICAGRRCGRPSWRTTRFSRPPTLDKLVGTYDIALARFMS